MKDIVHKYKCKHISKYSNDKYHGYDGYDYYILCWSTQRQFWYVVVDAPWCAAKGAGIRFVVARKENFNAYTTTIHICTFNFEFWILRSNCFELQMNIWSPSQTRKRNKKIKLLTVHPLRSNWYTSRFRVSF